MLIWTGPGIPFVAIRNALAMYSGIRVPLESSADHLVMGAHIATCGSSWRPPRPRFAGTSMPLSTMTGEHSANAIEIPGTELASPGPGETSTTDGFPVARDQPSAIWISPDSWRAVNTSMPSSRHASYTGNNGAPGSVKRRRIPCAFNARINNSPPVIFSIKGSVSSHCLRGLIGLFQPEHNLCRIACYHAVGRHVSPDHGTGGNDAAFSDFNAGKMMHCRRSTLRRE
jgi:hypothetical protein